MYRFRDRDAIEEVLALKPGDSCAGVEVLRRDVQNGHFVWWVKGGGCISINNLVASHRPEKRSPGARRTTPGKP